MKKISVFRANDNGETRNIFKLPRGSDALNPWPMKSKWN